MCLRRSGTIETKRIIRDGKVETRKRHEEWKETEDNTEREISECGITTTETQIARGRGDSNELILATDRLGLALVRRKLNSPFKSYGPTGPVLPELVKTRVYDHSILSSLPVLLFLMLYKVVLKFNSVDETVMCNHSSESY